MRISELARRTGHTVATIKYYIREGLLPAGTAVSATQAEYGQAHVDRLRLIRALIDIGRLSITTVRELLATLDDDDPDRDPGERVGVAVAAAHRALSGPVPAGAAPPEQALAAMATLGWQVDPGSPTLRELDGALAALDAVKLAPTDDTLQMYAQAALEVATAEVTGAPGGSPGEAIRYVVIGTVMYEPVLIALRRLAHQHVFRQLNPPGEPRRGS
jgi:DNA-binding transcriptional MerR regulator